MQIILSPSISFSQTGQRAQQQDAMFPAAGKATEDDNPVHRLRRYGRGR